MNPANLKFPLSFEKYVKEGGWCSFAFLQLTIVLIQFWAKRGIETKFNRMGPMIFRDGKRKFMMTTGWTPPDKYQLPITDSSTNYIHVLDLDGSPICQIHASNQSDLVAFLNEQFADLLKAQPITSDEMAQISEAVSLGNAGIIGTLPFQDDK